MNIFSHYGMIFLGIFAITAAMRHSLKNLLPWTMHRNDSLRENLIQMPNSNPNGAPSQVKTRILSGEGFTKLTEEGLGTSIAISNRRIVAGGRSGAVQLFIGDETRPLEYYQKAVWPPEEDLTGERFGASVDIDGDWIVIGVIKSNVSGTVHVFRIDDKDAITQTAIITADDGSPDDCFGCSLAIDGNRILVGASQWKNESNGDLGSAYLFADLSDTKDGTNWTKIFQFYPSHYVESVELEGNTAMVAGAGTVSIFETFSEDEWSNTYQMAGSAIALSSNFAVIGNVSSLDTPNPEVWVLVNDDENATEWSLPIQGSLLSPGGPSHNEFGTSVAISKDSSSIVVGAPHDGDTPSLRYPGAVYLIQNDPARNNGWTAVGKFVPSDVLDLEMVGTSVAIDDNIVVIGTGEGSIYVADIKSFTSSGWRGYLSTTTIIVIGLVILIVELW